MALFFPQISSESDLFSVCCCDNTATASRVAAKLEDVYFTAQLCHLLEKNMYDS